MNKKLGFIPFLFVLVVVSAFAGGKKEQVDLPDFVLTPPVSEEALYGVGYAKSENLAQALTIAKTRARADVARQLDTQIQSAITDYFQESGVTENKQNLNFIESISREVTNKKLKNSVVVKQYPTKDGGVWVLISVSQKEAVQAFEESANKFARSEEAAFSEFKAREAAALLDKLLKEKPTKSEPVAQ